MKELYKFPSTPHLLVLSEQAVRNDKVLTDAERRTFLSHELIVEEKVDGANLGISFDESGSLLFQNRGSFLHVPLVGQWKLLPGWANERLDALFEALGNHSILFGEWCYAEHSMPYTKLPDWFVGFDVFDKKTERFVSTRVRDAIFAKVGIATVPCVAKGRFDVTTLKGMIPMSRFADAPCEGLYLRHEDADWLIQRAKIVRHDFMQAIDEHWSKKALKVNRLTSFSSSKK